MSWFRRKTLTPEQVAEIASRAASEAVSKLLDNRRTSDTQALGQIVEGLFAKQMESFGKNTEAMSNFLGAMADLSIKRAAVALGQRGGRKRAENAEAKKRTEKPRTDCPVCADPRSTDQAAIIRHVAEGHDARRNGASQDAVLEHQRYVAAKGGSSLN